MWSDLDNLSVALKMSELRRRKHFVAKQPSAAEADDDVITPDDDVIKSRDNNCVYVMQDFLSAAVSRLYQPVDGSSLAVFRALFGE